MPDFEAVKAAAIPAGPPKSPSDDNGRIFSVGSLSSSRDEGTPGMHINGQELIRQDYKMYIYNNFCILR
jgi:hypothetical protein